MARVEIASLSLGWVTDTAGNAQESVTATILNLHRVKKAWNAAPEAPPCIGDQSHPVAG